ncbi:MAG: YraN family protein [Bacteroidia bacterium]|nr:YraN family protein [Bacteroidia bacterium]
MKAQLHEELTFEKVWFMFQETDKKFQETKQMFQETDKKLNKLEQLFTGQWGKLIESLIEGDLVNLLNKRNIQVLRTFTNCKFRYDNQNGEIDIIAANGEEVVVVEVKTTLRPDDINDFLQNLQIFKKAFPEYKNIKVFGAVAFLKAESKADIRAERMGLFVIKATGNSAIIVNDKNFKPKEF